VQRAVDAELPKRSSGPTWSLVVFQVTAVTIRAFVHNDFSSEFVHVGKLMPSIRVRNVLHNGVLHMTEGEPGGTRRHRPRGTGRRSRD
jgi:hypothetical protein